MVFVLLFYVVCVRYTKKTMSKCQSVLRAAVFLSQGILAHHQAQKSFGVETGHLGLQLISFYSFP